MSLPVLFLCLVLALNFFWEVGVDHEVHKERWFVAALLILITAAMVALVGILVQNT